MLRIYSIALFTFLFSLAAFGNPETNTSIEEFGILKYPVYTIGGETTGMALSVPRHNDYELEILVPEVLEKAKTLNGSFVKVKGILYTKTGVEVPAREIIQVSSLIVPTQKLKCVGAEYQGGIYEGGSLGIVQQKGQLLGVLHCLNERDTLTCREPNLVDAGYRLESLNDKAFRLFEMSFMGEKQIDMLLCE